MLLGAAGVGFAARGDGLFLLGSTRGGVLVLLPVAAAELAVVGIGAPDTRSVLLALYLGAGCSALAYALSAVGSRHLEAGHRSVILNVEVPIGAAAGAILLPAGPIDTHVAAHEGEAVSEPIRYVKL